MFGKFKKNKKIEKENEIETVVGESIKVKGNFTGQGSVVVNGCVEGNVQSNDTVFVGEKAKIIGSVDADKAVINGKIVGNLKIKDRLELKSTANINGDIKCASLIVEKGLIFNGTCNMGEIQNSKLKTQNDEV